MAHATEFDQSVLNQIAKGVASSLPIGFVRYNGHLQLGESLEVWALSTPLSATEEMSRAAVFTETYHHQIFLKGRTLAVGFARSRRNADHDATWEVTQVFESPLAQHIDEAITRVDRLVSANVLARLILAPEFQLTAFWFLEPGKDPCYIVHCPEKLILLKTGDLLEGADFLRLLKRQKPIVGLLHRRLPT
jgi:hypothetical protein